MSVAQYNRDELAHWYAQQHLKTDSGIRTVYYLPTDAPEREIRFVEVNTLIADRNDDELEPIDFGVDMGSDAEHTLLVLDVTPAQWEEINRSNLDLPEGWSLADAVPFAKT